MRDIRERGAQAGREPGDYAVAHVVCRASGQEALDDYHRYSVEHTGEAAPDYHMQQKKGFSSSQEDRAFVEYRQRFAAGAGSFPLVGTPAQIAAKLAGTHACGFAGAALSFVNYADELPFFCEQALPLLREAGLRHAPSPPA